MAKEIQPDLVLLDIMLPVMDGWQVCRELRKTSANAHHHAHRQGRDRWTRSPAWRWARTTTSSSPSRSRSCSRACNAVLRRTGDDGKPKSKKLTFDKLVINLDYL